MQYNSIFRSRSLECLENYFNFYDMSPKLLWANWAELPSLNYLNLIDCGLMKKSSKCIPWFHVTFTQSEINHYCSLAIYENYKNAMMKRIAMCNHDDLPTLIQKVLSVCSLLKMNRNDEESSNLYFFIANNLLEKGCENPNIFLELWEILCLKNKAKVAVFSGVIGKYRKTKSVKLLKYILRLGHSVHFDFWGAWIEGDDLRSFVYCPVTASLLNGCIEQLIVLFDYGFKPNSKRIHTYDAHFKFWFDSVYDWLKRPFMEKSTDRRKTIAEVLLILINIGKCRSRTRYLSMTKCFQLLWTVIPTPIVTLEELKTEVHQQFFNPPNPGNVILFPTTEEHFMELCDFYAVLLSHENITTLQPRSLKHLSKCAVRNQLQRCWTLPSGITSLKLPKSLVSYLQVETHVRN